MGAHKKSSMKTVVSSLEEDTVLADQLFKQLDKKHTKPGTILKGLRARENMTQIEFSKKIKVTQSDLSKMECGKCLIEEILAKRIAQKFDIDYQLLLDEGS